jgi:hypothetical protein
MGYPCTFITLYNHYYTFSGTCACIFDTALWIENTTYNYLLTERLYSQQTGVNYKKTQVSPRVPVHLTYNMDRFAQISGKKSGDGNLRSPLIFRHAETQTQSEARMQAELRHFDDKFNKTNSSSDKGTRAKK